MVRVRALLLGGQGEASFCSRKVHFLRQKPAPDFTRASSSAAWFLCAGSRGKGPELALGSRWHHCWKPLPFQRSPGAAGLSSPAPEPRPKVNRSWEAAFAPPGLQLWLQGKVRHRSVDRHFYVHGICGTAHVLGTISPRPPQHGDTSVTYPDLNQLCPGNLQLQG